MDYAAFKSFVATHLWKQDDAVLIENLDNLIKMADSELEVKLDLERRNVIIDIAPIVLDHPLPDDFKSVSSLSGYGTVFSQTTKADIFALRGIRAEGVCNKYYAANNILYLAGNGIGVTTPAALTLAYRQKIPDFQATNESYIADDYLALYVYTVLSHAAPFLREDERLQQWQQLKADAFASTVSDDKWSTGSPMHTRPARSAPNRSKRR